MPYDTFYLRTNVYFYYGPNAAFNEAYRFRFTTTPPSGVTTNITVTGGLTNISPTITDFNPDDIYTTLDQFVHKFNGLNGSNTLGPYEGLDQLWTIISQKDSNDVNVNMFFITNSINNFPNKRGQVYFIDPVIPGGEFNYTVIIALTDAGGLSAQRTMYIQNAV